MQEQTGHREKRSDRATPMATDPVCRMKVPIASACSYSLNGSEAVFYGTRCRDRFASDPSKYLSTKKQAPVLTRPSTLLVKASSTRAYTCPMHPEVPADQPGSCPKCGMALEPVSPAAPEKADIDADRFFHAVRFPAGRRAPRARPAGRRASISSAAGVPT